MTQWGDFFRQAGVKLTKVHNSCVATLQRHRLLALVFYNAKKANRQPSVHLWFIWKLLPTASALATPLNLISPNFLVIIYIDLERTDFFHTFLKSKMITQILECEIIVLFSMVAFKGSLLKSWEGFNTFTWHWSLGKWNSSIFFLEILYTRQSNAKAEQR